MHAPKREADNTTARQWYRHMAEHAEFCQCGHPQWRHMGLGEPACTWLGRCPCPAFETQMRRTA